MTTLSQTLTALKKEGYTEDFNLKQNYLEGRNFAIRVFADDFVVDKHFRFEGDSSPTTRPWSMPFPRSNTRLRAPW
ncbi:hypothetical protein [Hymenobacter sp. BRD128]|uniref:hypothetical protein n=1 Tax=Hymenobacter sp. BRD128 TaxID=2675878 RepID=UPI0020B86E77|nr:hypothetical protein [Hymenobacter sp. BRD128]